MDERTPTSSAGGVCIAEHSGPRSQVTALLFSRCAQEARRAVNQLDEAFAEITVRAGGRAASDPPLEGEPFDALAAATRKASRSVEDFRLIESRAQAGIGDVGGGVTFTPAIGVGDLREGMRRFATVLGLRPRDAVTVPVGETRPSTPPPDFTALPASLSDIVVRWSFARPAMLDGADAMEAIFRVAWRLHLERVAPDE